MGWRTPFVYRYYFLVGKGKGRYGIRAARSDLGRLLSAFFFRCGCFVVNWRAFVVLMHVCLDLGACLDVDLGASLDVVQAISHDVL